RFRRPPMNTFSRLILILTLGLALAPLHAQETSQLQALVDVFSDPGDAVQAELVQGVVVLSGEWQDDPTPAGLLEALRSQPDIVAIRDNTTLAAAPAGLEPTVTRFQRMLDKLLVYLPLAGTALAIVIGFWLLSGMVRWVEPALGKVLRNAWIRRLVVQLLQTAIFIAGIVLALDTLNATALVGSILGAAGIVGIAVGFAFRDLIENYIASLMLGIRQPFRPGDHVDIEGREGIVATLTTRSTILMTFEGNRLRIPNGEVFKSTIMNYSTHPERRFSFTVGVGYTVDLAAAINLGVEILRSSEGVIEDPAPAGRVSALGDSTVTLTFFAWVNQDQADFGWVRSQCLIRVKQAFEAHQLDMPEPTYNLRIASKTEDDQPLPRQAPATPEQLEPEPAPADEFARTQAALEAEQAEDSLIDSDTDEGELGG
ncbi:MAG: mechanosensitive ion channel family protein, partial [Pseudomonadota bacterium]